MYVLDVHACVWSACVYIRVCVCVAPNLTRDYMSPTELMSKSTGSAFGLTGGRAERKRGMMGTLEEEEEKVRKRG